VKIVTLLQSVPFFSFPLFETLNVDRLIPIHHHLRNPHRYRTPSYTIVIISIIILQHHQHGSLSATTNTKSTNVLQGSGRNDPCCKPTTFHT
jgi:hypothetical protein